MYCKTCGAELGPNDIYCAICGTRTGNRHSGEIGEKAESVLAAAKHQMMQGASTGSDILAISSVLEEAGGAEDGGTVLLEEPGGMIPGVTDMNQVENGGFRDRSMSVTSGSSSGSTGSGSGTNQAEDSAFSGEIPGLWPEWTVNERIGQGSFGTVYRIEKKNFGRSYFSALKVISVPQNPADVDNLFSEGMSHEEVSNYYTDAVQKIVDEFDLMAQLRGHSNIVSYEDHKVIPKPGGIGYDILIRMELLKPFNKYLRENGNEIGRMEVLRLGTDICRALEACETMHVIHRDIKPENIFVHHLGSFKLGDFGVAREMERTMTVMSKKGTYSYMAPEVYAGKEYDRTVDLYSLGIMLYRYFNGGRLPFVEQGVKVTSEYREQALMKRIGGVPLPKPQYARDCIWRVIKKATAFLPADRYQSAEEMRLDLEDAAAEVAARAHEESGELVANGLETGESSQKPVKPELGRTSRSEASEKKNTGNNRTELPKNDKRLHGRFVREEEEENVTVSGVGFRNEENGAAGGVGLQNEENGTVRVNRPQDPESATVRVTQSKKDKASAKKDTSISYFKENVRQEPSRLPLKYLTSILLLAAIVACLIFQAYSVTVMIAAIAVTVVLYILEWVIYSRNHKIFMAEYWKWKEAEETDSVIK